MIANSGTGDASFTFGNDLGKMDASDEVHAERTSSGLSLGSQSTVAT